MKPIKKISFFGGAGFIGSSVVKILANKGFEIKIATRNPYDEDVIQLKSSCGDPGQITLHRVNINSKDQVEAFIKESNICINLIGLSLIHI